jgi:hypothetical protein
MNNGTCKFAWIEYGGDTTEEVVVDEKVDEEVASHGS